MALERTIREQEFKLHVDGLKHARIVARREQEAGARAGFVTLLNTLGLGPESRYDGAHSLVMDAYQAKDTFLLKHLDKREIFNQHVLDIISTRTRIVSMSAKDKEEDKEDGARDPRSLIMFYALMMQHYTKLEAPNSLDDFVRGSCVREDTRWKECEDMPLHIQRAAFDSFGHVLKDRLVKACWAWLLDDMGRCECLSASW